MKKQAQTIILVLVVVLAIVGVWCYQYYQDRERVYKMEVEINKELDAIEDKYDQKILLEIASHGSDFQRYRKEQEIDKKKEVRKKRDTELNKKFNKD